MLFHEGAYCDAFKIFVAVRQSITELERTHHRRLSENAVDPETFARELVAGRQVRASAVPELSTTISPPPNSFHKKSARGCFACWFVFFFGVR